MESEYDVIVIGAGIGGLTTASILAKEGMKVGVFEREGRVGGRALSIEGGEITREGPDWYRGILGRHYCYLAESDPGIDTIVENGLLDGYVLDLGYHGVPCAGKGYLGRLTGYLGIDVGVNPCDTGLRYKGTFYREPAPGETRLDDKIYRICKDKGIKFWSFNTEAFGKDEEWFDRQEKVSLFEYCERLGLTADDVIWQSYRCSGTLFTTINNPHDISAGEMLRYTNDVMMPLIASGEELHVGGFTEGGIGNWSRSVAGELQRLGGTVSLGSDVLGVKVEGGRVTGAQVSIPGGEEISVRAGRAVITAPIQETFDIVDPDLFDSEFVDEVSSLYGYGSLAPYFGLSELPMPPEEAKRLIKTPVVVPADGDYDYDVYMCWNVQSEIDPGCSPEGKHLLTAYLPLTEKESRDREKVMRVVEEVPLFFERTYPGFNDCVEWALFPMCWKLEGVAKSISQAGTLKPEVKAPGLEGLFFSGDTARGFGVAMDCACSAGINCAAAILGRDLGIE